MKDLVMAAGGSGGHLVPAIALLQHNKLTDLRTAILSTSKSVDKRLSKKYEEFEFIHQSINAFDAGLKNKVKSVLGIALNVPRVIHYLYNQRCRSLFSTGGFGCIGAVMSAAVLGIPVLFHESNSVPGKATRLLSGLLKCLYVTPLSNHPFLLRKSRKMVGFPLRSDFSEIDQEQAKQQLGISVDASVLLVIGGSQGAEALNDWVIRNQEYFLNKQVYVICITGVQGSDLKSDSKYVRFQSFTDEMDVLLSAADGVISRSGAGSIAEIAYSQTPAILIPYPHAALDHQRLNAEQFVAYGCAAMLEQSEIETLLDKVNTLLNSESVKYNMRVAQKHWQTSHSINPIVADICNILNQNPRV